MAYFAACGIKEALYVEPSHGVTWEKLKENAEKFKKVGYKFELAQVAVGAERKTVMFIDRENCARGGSSRSVVRDVVPKSRTRRG